jgi:hypothetical protein
MFVINFHTSHEGNTLRFDTIEMNNKIEKDLENALAFAKGLLNA